MSDKTRESNMSKDLKWIKENINNQNVEVVVDNDMVNVYDKTTGEEVYAFEEFGYRLLLPLFEVLGIEADLC